MFHRLVTGLLAVLCCALLSPASSKELDLQTATVLDVQEAFDNGLTAERLVEVYLARIEAYDQTGPALNTILKLNGNALQIARELDEERARSGPRSPLHGIPVLVKDNYDTYDLPTTGGAIALADAPLPLRDAFTVARLREAGAIVLAKTNTDEFARGGTGTSSLGGQVLNAYNLQRIPGGSSAGSGQAVAALFGHVGLGTETGSSIRNPATKANLVGFSPSEGLVSRSGIIPISITYDRAGPMTRNVTDAAITMAIMAGTDAADLFSYGGLGYTPSDYFQSALREDGLQGARVGVLRGLFGAAEEDEPAVALIDQAIETLRDQGAVVIDPLPTNGVDIWKVVNETRYSRAEARPALEHYFAQRGPEFPVSNMPELVSGGVLGRLEERYAEDHVAEGMIGNPNYVAAHAGRKVLRDYIHTLMDAWQLDALVYPHETTPVRTIDEAVPNGGATRVNGPAATGPGGGNRLSTATGLPTLTVPVGFNVDGVPVGIEMLGRLYDEATLIRLAFAYEQAAPHRRLPPTTPLLGIEVLRY